MTDPRERRKAIQAHLAGQYAKAEAMWAQGHPGIAATSPLSPADAVPGTSWSADETQGPTEAQKGSTVQDDWRAALAEALGVHDYPPLWQRGREGIADLLLPTVRHLAAEELRAVAVETDTWSRVCPPGRESDAYAHAHDALRARADALDATPDHGKA